MSQLVTDAGKSDSPKPSPATPTTESARRALFRHVATKLRAAQSDDEAADALEALVELSRE